MGESTDTEKRVIWQHIVPRDHNHDVSPIHGWYPYLCSVCGDEIQKVSEKEGPEALKALFRF